MFEEEAAWVGAALERVGLPEGGSVLDVGSSTASYRLREQPHIEREVFEPLRARGMRLVRLDVKHEAGVDVVADITDPEFSLGEEFDLVLCNNVLVHVSDVPRAAAALRDLPRPGGLLLVTTPQVYRKVRDPLDNGLRPSPDELASLVGGLDGFKRVELASVRIDDPAYYRGFLGRPSRQLIRGRWLPLPGAAEAIRYRARGMRWRVSCVLLGRTSSS